MQPQSTPYTEQHSGQHPTGSEVCPCQCYLACRIAFRDKISHVAFAEREWAPSISEHRVTLFWGSILTKFLTMHFAGAKNTNLPSGNGLSWQTGDSQRFSKIQRCENSRLLGAHESPMQLKSLLILGHSFLIPTRYFSWLPYQCLEGLGVYCLICRIFTLKLRVSFSCINHEFLSI